MLILEATSSYHSNKYFTVLTSCSKIKIFHHTWWCLWVKSLPAIQKLLSQSFKSSKWINIFKKLLMVAILINISKPFLNISKKLLLTFLSLLLKSSIKCQKDKSQKTWRKIILEVMMFSSKKIISSIKKKVFGDIWSIGTASNNKVIKEVNLLSPSPNLTTVKINLKVKKLNYKKKETQLLITFTWQILRKKYKK